MMAARAVTAQPGTQSCAATLSLGFVNYLVVSRGTALLRGCTRRGGERLKRFRAGVCVHVPRIRRCPSPDREPRRIHAGTKVKTEIDSGCPAGPEK